MLAKGMPESPPPSQSFFRVHNISNSMEKDETNIKVERISLLLARIHRKMDNFIAAQ